MFELGFIGGFTAIGVGIYFLPTIVCRTPSMFLCNLLFGWTVVGWFLCLTVALFTMSESKSSRREKLEYYSRINRNDERNWS